MYRCFREKFPIPDADVIKSPTHTSPWTDGDTFAAVCVCPAVVVSLLINHHVYRFGLFKSGCQADRRDGGDMKGMRVHGPGIRLLIWMAVACVGWQRPQLSFVGYRHGM